MQVGAHVSVSKGYEEALDYARSVGCECAQIFAKSPRQWRAKPLDAEAAAAFRQARQASGFGPVFTHTAYLINLSTSNEELREKSIAALADELVRGGVLGAAGVVTHIGNDPEDDRRAAARRAGEAVARAFELAGEGRAARLLVENTAGAGRTFGGPIEELAWTLDASGLAADRLGVCFDTCHGFAFGMELRTAAGWDDLTSALARDIGLDRVGLIHANDCMFELGSRRDRHAWIGEGLIGEEGFHAMMCCSALANVPVVTEMPGEVPEKDAVNVSRLIAMREMCA